MKEKRKKFNVTYISFGILLVGYLISAINFAKVSRTTGSDSDGESGLRVVRVAHWQLEPGYREGMEWAIEKYNALPHVREANVMVQQMGITERVYNQFMNVHLISGTAPDIAASGMTRLITGNAIAKFYAPLSDYVTQPNPYNAPEYLSDSRSEEIREFVSTAPWRETFIDGMEGGFNAELNDYYSIPISSWGGQRLFYNMEILTDVKAFIREAFAQAKHPVWLRATLTDTAGPADFAVLPDTPELRAWLEDDSVPETLGQLLLALEATYHMSREKNLEYLVGVSASNYAPNKMSTYYRNAFFNQVGAGNDFLQTGVVTGFEALVGLEGGVWSFQHPAIRSHYELEQRFVRYYPHGWVGLDREQSQRRFVMGNALLMASGGWDASGVVSAVQERSDGFRIEISRAPIPGEGERYAEFLPYMISEAESRVGVPLAVNRRSKNFDWAIDFLKYVSSLSVNEELNRRAGWVPAIVGAELIEHMEPFAPVVEGLPGPRSIQLSQTKGRFLSVFNGAEPLLANSEITYDQFVKRLQDTLDNPRLGMNDVWFRQWQLFSDQSRERDSGLSIERAKALLAEDALAAERFPSLIYNKLLNDEGYSIRRLHYLMNPGTPFPFAN